MIGIFEVWWMKHSTASGTEHAVSNKISILFLKLLKSIPSQIFVPQGHTDTGEDKFRYGLLEMFVTLTTGTPLKLGSVFIFGTVVSWSASSDISDTLSAPIQTKSCPSSVHFTRVTSQESGSPFSKSMLFCKTTTLITAVPSHYMNQCSVINILPTSK